MWPRSLTCIVDNAVDGGNSTGQGFWPQQCQKRRPPARLFCASHGTVSVARSAEIAVVYGGGLAQGLALVSFPAAATILTAADGYGLSSNQYGSIFLPPFAGSVLASLLAPTLARRRSLKRVLLAGFGCNALSMATFALSATLTGMAELAFAMVLAATGLLGIGFGATLTAINAYAAKPPSPLCTRCSAPGPLWRR